MRPRIAKLLLLVLACVPLATTPAFASQMVGSNARYVSLKVGFMKGREVAAIGYASGGQWHHVLAWGAINARPYSSTHKQVAFALNYAGGYNSVFGANAWKRLSNRCVSDPALKRKLPVVVLACTMSTNHDEHWALQSWQRTLPNAGVRPKTALQRDYELHLSHWTGNPPVLWLKWGWALGRTPSGAQIYYDHLYGAFAFHGVPVYGHASTSIGNPTDTYGRNIYVDAVNPVWSHHGAYTQPGGWVRFNGFLTHYRRGNFCASVYQTNLGVYRPGYRSATAYRATAMGPGVTPIARWVGPPPGSYQPFAGPTFWPPLLPIFPSLDTPRSGYTVAKATALNDEQKTLATSADKTCWHVYGPS